MQKLNSKRWPKKFGIYCIINLVDGKRYVGSAINLKERLKETLDIVDNIIDENISYTFQYNGELYHINYQEL